MEPSLVNTSQSTLASVASVANLSFNQFLARDFPPLITHTGFNPDKDCTDERWNIDVSHPSPSWPCAFVEPVDRKRRVAHHRPVQFPYALTYSATYNVDGRGYNITLPGELCAETVVGDFVTPAGNLHRNASLVTVHNSLSNLSPLTLRSFTERRLRFAQSRLYNALKPYMCDPPSGGSRELLFRYSTSDRTGDCCWALLSIFGSLAIWAGSMYVPLANPVGTGNWTGNQVFGLATVGIALMVTYNVVLDRLRRQELTLQSWEANSLNFFIAAGEAIVQGLRASWGGICTAPAALWHQASGFCAQSRLPGLQAPGAWFNAGEGRQAQEIVAQGVCPAPGEP